MPLFNFLPENSPTQKIVRYWLYTGLFMLLMQIVIGGVTRLTGSGLSITKWEIVTGTLPPLSETDWLTEFDAYKATPQYHKINAGMSLSDFKFIYFWEYFHRLWARWMGFVFLLPFLYFLIKGMLHGSLIRRLGGVIALAALAASFGWIMVASGLINRPWVNAYKLTIHLTIGFSVLAWLFWATLHEIIPQKLRVQIDPKTKNWLRITSLFALIQFMLGGVMSGMKAGLFIPTWPKMNTEWIPAIIFNIEMWNVDNFVNYDKNPFMPALIHFLHRTGAYVLIILVLYSYIKFNTYRNSRLLSTGKNLLVTLLVIQILLGILTVINCVSSIPVVLGALHQIVGVFLLCDLIFLNYIGNKSE